MIRFETFTVYNCLIMLMIAHSSDTWEGTASQLLNELTPLASSWVWARLPPNGRSLVVEINKVKSHTHLSIEYRRVGKRRDRLIRIQKDTQFAAAPPPFYNYGNVFERLQVSRRFDENKTCNVKSHEKRLAGFAGLFGNP